MSSRPKGVPLAKCSPDSGCTICADTTCIGEPGTVCPRWYGSTQKCILPAGHDSLCDDGICADIYHLIALPWVERDARRAAEKGGS